MRHQHRRRHGERGCHHAADHELEAEPLGLLRHGERLGKSAGLVELDVDRVIFAPERRKRGAVVYAFVGADRQRALDLCEYLVVSGRQRLLDQGDAGIGAGGEVFGQVVRGPALVGIDDKLGARGGPPHRRDPVRIARAAEFDFEERAVGRPLGGCRHRRGRRERDGVGGSRGFGRRQARERMHPRAGALGRKIPESAVERIACRARWQRPLQRRAVEAAGDVGAHRCDRLLHALDGLAIARIGHAFAPPAAATV